MKGAFIFILICLASLQVSAQIGHECSSRIFTDLVTPLKYPLEEHQVVTSDGYVLRVFRIQAKNTQITSGKKVILLQHGNESSSDDWVLNDESLSPAFFLANQGYDVWMGNNRGNKYSLKNTKISRYSKSFWDFSFQEMGARDMPATVAYILKVTGQPNLVAVGHSQGSTQWLAGLADPDSTQYLNSKVTKFIGLAPVVYATQCYNKALKEFADNPLILDACDVWGQWDMFPAACSIDSPEALFMEYLCTIANEMCKQFLAGGDLDPVYDNTKRLNIFLSHSPNGASVRVFQHFAQMFYQPKSDPQFMKFDFGRYENQKRYGQPTPPPYDFRNIKIPVAVFAGLQDTLADPGDSVILKNNLLKAGVTSSFYQYNQWGHMTYVWGLNPQGFFQDLLKEIQAVTGVVA